MQPEFFILNLTPAYSVTLWTGAAAGFLAQLEGTSGNALFGLWGYSQKLAFLGLRWRE